MKDDDIIAYMEGVPDWAIRKAGVGEICRMQQAYTKDGSKHGNAVIVDICIRDQPVSGTGSWEPKPTVLITLVTEAGNIIRNMNPKEFEHAFTPGVYVMRDFPTTESAKAWKAEEQER